MNSRHLFSLYLEPSARPQPRYRAIDPPRSPYLSQVRPVNLEPVRPALDPEPPRLSPASPAMGLVEKVSLCLMVFIATAFGVYMAFGAGHLLGVRKEAVLARDLHRAEVELAAANLARRELAATLADRLARESEPAAVRVVMAPVPTRRSGSRR